MEPEQTDNADAESMDSEKTEVKDIVLIELFWLIVAIEFP